MYRGSRSSWIEKTEEIIEITAPRNKKKCERKSKRNESLNGKVQFMSLDF